MRILLSSVLLFLLVGCAMTVGNTFDPDKVDLLTPGVSTSADAKQLLGEPTAESSYEDGSKLLQWQFSSGTVFGGWGAHVAILFDRHDKMVRVTHKSKV